MIASNFFLNEQNFTKYIHINHIIHIYYIINYMATKAHILFVDIEQVKVMLLLWIIVIVNIAVKVILYITYT